MIKFWLIAGVFIAGALLFVLPPLLRKTGKKSQVDRRASNISIYQDQLAELEADLQSGVISAEQSELSRKEIDRRLLEDVAAGNAEAAPTTVSSGRAAAIAIGIAVPVLAVLLYRAVGNPDALNPPPPPPPLAQGGPVTPERIQQMVESLAARLEQNPNDAQGWSMLGRSYTAMGRYTEAVAAYEKAAVLVPDDVQMLTDYADVLAVANGKNLQGKPLELINKALQIDPNNLKGLALAGTAAFQIKDFAHAVSYWEKLVQLLPPQSPLAQRINTGIADARALAAGKQPPSQMAAASQQGGGAQAASGGAQITGVVTLTPALAAKAAPSDQLFVFAKAMSGGPPMPLAVMRAQVKDLPLKFTLNDSMAMAPMMKLSNFQQVMISAKISKTGNATPQSGDLKGEVAPVKVGANDVQVVIDKMVP